MSLTAIFGGTFNPPHIGHYEMLAALEKSRKIEKILVTPTKIPPHKICDFLAKDSDRIDMCNALITNFKKAELCLSEFDRNCKSYTFDTVTQLKNENPETNFAFVCGGDMIESLDTWYRADELMKLLPFIVFRRLENGSAIFEKKIKNYREQGMKIIIMPEIIPCISSSYIRKNILSSYKLLPQNVADIIKSRRIYNAGL